MRATLPVLFLRRKGCGAAWNTCSWVFGSRNGSFSTSSSYLLYGLLMQSPPPAYLERALSLLCPRLRGMRAFGLDRHSGCNMLLRRVFSRGETPSQLLLAVAVLHRTEEAGTADFMGLGLRLGARCIPGATAWCMSAPAASSAVCSITCMGLRCGPIYTDINIDGTCHGCPGQTGDS